MSKKSATTYSERTIFDGALNVYQALSGLFNLLDARQGEITHNEPIGSPVLVFWRWKANFELHMLDPSHMGSKHYFM